MDFPMKTGFRRLQICGTAFQHRTCFASYKMFLTLEIAWSIPRQTLCNLGALWTCIPAFIMQKIFRSQLELLQQNIVRSLNLQIQPRSIWKTSNALEIYYILVFLKPRHHSYWQPLEGSVAMHPICSLCSSGFETTLETSLAIVAAEVDFTGENLCRDRASQQLQDALMAASS